MIRLDGISKSFPSPSGPKRVFDDLDFDADDGELVSIVGVNGSGKTTLMRLIAGLLQPDKGRIQLDKHGAERETVSLVPQRYRESLFPWRTVKANLMLPFEASSEQKEATAAGVFIDGMLEQLRIRDLQARRPGTLSGGQAQLVAIARAFAAPWCNVLLLDEPFSALDGANLKTAADLIMRTTRDRHATTVLITHDIDMGILIADRVAVLGSEAAGIVDFVDSRTTGPIDDIAQLTTPEFIECKRRIFQAMVPPS